MKTKNIFLWLCLLCAGYVIYYRFTHTFLTESQLFVKLWPIIVPTLSFAFMSSLYDERKPNNTEVLKAVDYMFSIAIKILVVIALIVVILFIDLTINEPTNPRFYR